LTGRRPKCLDDMVALLSLALHRSQASVDKFSADRSPPRQGTFRSPRTALKQTIVTVCKLTSTDAILPFQCCRSYHLSLLHCCIFRMPFPPLTANIHTITFRRSDLFQISTLIGFIFSSFPLIFCFRYVGLYLLLLIFL